MTAKMTQAQARLLRQIAERDTVWWFATAQKTRAALLNKGWVTDYRICGELSATPLGLSALAGYEARK